MDEDESFDDPTADQCDRAASLIREMGWSKGRLQNENGAICISGALALVLNGDPRKTLGLVDSPLYKSVLVTLNQNLGTNYTLLSMWNDHQDRKQEEVVDLLRDAASKRRLS